MKGGVGSLVACKSVRECTQKGKDQGRDGILIPHDTERDEVILNLPSHQPKMPNLSLHGPFFAPHVACVVAVAHHRSIHQVISPSLQLARFISAVLESALPSTDNIVEPAESINCFASGLLDLHDP